MTSSDIDQSCAKICQVILNANDGMAQQIYENRTDLLDLLTKEELLRKDDLDLTLPYLAIYYDMPIMLEYLHKRGIDLKQPCDPYAFGSPMFYAVTMKKHQCIITLDELGYTIETPCTSNGELPELFANQLDDDNMRTTFDFIENRARILREKLEREVQLAHEAEEMNQKKLNDEQMELERQSKEREEFEASMHKGSHSKHKHKKGKNIKK